MAKQRTLHDLYVVGKELTLDDGQGGVTVWLQKISPAEHQKCIRRADAARARLTLALRDTDSDEYLTVMAETIDVAKDTLVEYLIVEEQQKLQLSVEAELELGTDSRDEPTEWGKDSYLQGLRTAWDERLRDQWTEDENDPEAQRVLAELTRFADEVRAAVDPVLADIREAHLELDIDELRRRVIDQFVDMRATGEWVAEYENSRIYYAVRRPENHRAYYFNAVDDVDTLDTDVRSSLMRAYQAIEVAVSEGKGSRRATSSSPSSASPAEPTVQSSGHETPAT